LLNAINFKSKQNNMMQIYKVYRLSSLLFLTFFEIILDYNQNCCFKDLKTNGISFWQSAVLLENSERVLCATDPGVFLTI
jgi:hypothetical protein